MSDYNLVATPADKSSVYADDNSDVLEENVPYRETVGSLVYLTTATRPDISFAVSVVSQAPSKKADLATLEDG